MREAAEHCALSTRCKRELNPGFDVSWTPIPTKSASNQTPFVRVSAVPPAHPSQAVARSSNLLQQQSPAIIPSYSATSELLWSMLKLLLYSTSWFSTVTCWWYWSATCAEEAMYHDASVHLVQRQSSRAERSATGLQPVITLMQKWHFQGNSSVKANEIPPPARKKMHINTQNYVLWGCVSWY